MTGEVDRVDADGRRVVLEDGTVLDYDYLVIASGTTPRPDQTPGMLGEEWRRSVNEFYTFEGSLALRDNLAAFEGGRLVVHITELPFKCPVAPAGVHLPRRRLAAPARPARAHRARLRDAAGRRVHQARREP